MSYSVAYVEIIHTIVITCRLDLEIDQILSGVRLLSLVHNMTQDIALRYVSICEHPPLRLRRVA